MEIELPNGQIAEFPDNTPHEQITAVLKKQFPSQQNKEPEDPGAYLDAMPDEEVFFHKLPRNIATGLAHIGRGLHNLPHDVAEGIDVVGSGIGRMFGAPELQDKNSNIADYFPNDTTNYANVFGQKGEGTLMDNLIQKGIEYAPEIAGGKALLKSGIRRLKGAHHLDEVRKAVKNKGLSNFQYPKEMVKEAKKYLPKGEASGQMIKDMMEGKYNPAFDMQSQIGLHKRALEKSLIPADRLLAPKLGDLKQNMLNHLGNVLRKNELHEEADMLKTGIKKYSDYKKFMEKAGPVLKYAGIPVTAITGFDYAKKKIENLLND